MELILQTETPPLRRDVSGALRVGRSRVLLELVIRAFQDGATPRGDRATLPERSVSGYLCGHRLLFTASCRHRIVSH
jgi:hypothetical protein